MTPLEDRLRSTLRHVAESEPDMDLDLAEMTTRPEARRSRNVLVAAAVAGVLAAVAIPVLVVGIARHSAPPEPTGTSQVSPSVATTSAPTTSATSSAPRPALHTGIVQGKDGWSTYTYAPYRFSIRFPSTIYGPSGSRCVNGKASPGDVAATAQRITSNPTSGFYIFQKYAYLPFYGCRRLRLDWEDVDLNYQPPVAAMLLRVMPAATEADLRNVIDNYFTACSNPPTLGFAPSASGSWTNVTISCRKETPSVVRWYPEPGLIVQFGMTALRPAIKDVHGKNVESEIENSFTPL